MLYTYFLSIGFLQKQDYLTYHRPLEEALWIDCLNITPEEKSLIENTFKITLPTKEEMQEIEVSSRLYEEDGTMYMTANIISHADSEHPTSDAVTFIISPKVAITLRYCEPKSFALFEMRVMKALNLYTSPVKILVGLLETIIDRTADMLEITSERIENISRSIFGPSEATHQSSDYLTDLLDNVGKNNELLSKIHQSLSTLSRITKYFLHHLHHHELTHEIHTLEADIASLLEYASFLSHKLNFLLDATLGKINIAQNAIIKIFSVVAVIFLPPTLIASIYGMNFDFIPELHWKYGYLVAVGLMVFSAILPFAYFKRKKWL